MSPCPCKECVNRHRACHATCELYLKFKAELEACKANDPNRLDISKYNKELAMRIKREQWRNKPKYKTKYSN